MTDYFDDDRLHYSFHIDTNRINSKGKLEYMNQLEMWHDQGIITIQMSEVVCKEIVASKNSKLISKTYNYIHSVTFANTQKEQKVLESIEKILFPSGCKNQNEWNDVEIVFNAIKYHQILITDEGDSKSQPGGMLGYRDKLKALGAKIMRDSEAVEFIKGEIKKKQTMRLRHQALQDRHKQKVITRPKGIVYNYRGHEIRPQPRQLKESSKWTVRAYIGRGEGDKFTERLYWSTSICGDTKEEATSEAIKMCKLIIDEKNS